MCKIEEKIVQVEKGLRSEYFIIGDKPKSINELMRETNTPGISLSIIHNFEVVWAEGYGTADIETQQPVDTNTIFQAASISKALTALAVMKLVQDGKLKLEENINTYLKTWKLPENEFTARNKVTLRNLLSHTAGVTVHGFPGYKQGSEIPTLVQVLKGEAPAITGKVVVDMEPDTEFRYSGGGTVIVQQVLIDQLQKPFQDIMRELVLEPLGMKNSFFSNVALDEEQRINAASGHNSDGGLIAGKSHIYPEMAAAGFWSTAEDLAKFSIAVQKCLIGEAGGILTKEFMNIMTTPVLSGEYNIGLRNEGVYKEQLVGHNGGNAGYSCSMLFHKEKGFGVVLMTNSDSGYKLKLPILRSAAAAFGWDNILQPDYELAPLSSEELKLFCGNYKMEFDKTLKIYQQDNKLLYKTIYDEPMPLDYVGGNTLLDASRTVKLELRSDTVSLYMNGNEIERLDNGEKLAGDYIEEGNIEQAVNFYRELIAKDSEMQNWLENSLNDAGYSCLWRKAYKKAVAFLRIGTILFPDSSNAWDSLGEVYFEDGQYKQCVEAMKKSLEYNPNNQNAADFIKEAERCLEN
jgi:CubicO group peptidase (beta-lactamase class C family)